MFNKNASAGDNSENQGHSSDRFKKIAMVTGIVLLNFLGLASAASIFIVPQVVTHHLALWAGIALVSLAASIGIAARSFASKLTNKQMQAAAASARQHQTVAHDGPQISQQQEVGTVQGTVPSMPGNVTMSSANDRVSPTPQYQLPGYAAPAGGRVR